MASINNWLAFSLSPMEHPSSLNYPYQAHPSPTTVSADCFSFSADSSSDIDLLNGSAHHINQHQDWSMKNCELSMLVTDRKSNADDGEPKLENFLSGHSFLYNDQSYSMQIPPAAMMASGIGINSSSNGMAALSAREESQSSSGMPLESLALMENGDKKKVVVVDDKCVAGEEVNKKSVETFGQRTSIYRGVTRHRWTGRYEAHLWDNSCKREGQTRKGRQVYLGGYDKEEKAARAYDLAALKYWGATTTTNFPVSDYEKELEEMKHATRLEYVASIRRKSSGFSRGASIYRGVTRHHQHGRWQARIGRVAGNKDLYLGTFTTQEEAAEAYDIAAIKFRGLNAITNFEMSRYDVKSIIESSTLPIGPAAKRLKEASSDSGINNVALSSQLTEGVGSYGWPSTIAFQQMQPLNIHYPYGYQQHSWCKQEEDYSAVAAHSLHEMSSFHHHQQQQQPIIHNVMAPCAPSLELGMGMGSDDGKHIFGWPDSYRNAYYPQGVARLNDYEPSSDHSGGLMAAASAQGAPLFTIWNES